jgi:ABC-2 type transport system ATP-binding protein
LHGIGARETRERAAVQLARVGLADRAGDKVRFLSGGQMRRVEIARALLHRPRMLLLDEPTAGLDIKARAGILEVVRGLVADEGIGVLWTTHLVDEIRDDDHVVVLHKGRMLANGPSRSIVGAAGARSIGEAFTALTTGEEETER